MAARPDASPCLWSFVKCHDRDNALRFDGHRRCIRQRFLRVFPPKTEEMERSLWETINRLAPLTRISCP